MMFKHIVNAIVAFDDNGGFGKGGKIPWNFSEDMVHFKTITRNCIGLMGRSTYEDLNKIMGERGAQSVLPNRNIFVLSSTMDPVPNAIVVRSLDDFARRTESYSADREIFFLGGLEIYNIGFPFYNRVYVTRVKGDYKCDRFFPVDRLEREFTVSYHDTAGDLTFQTYSKPWNW